MSNYQLTAPKCYCSNLRFLFFFISIWYMHIYSFKCRLDVTVRTQTGQKDDNVLWQIQYYWLCGRLSRSGTTRCQSVNYHQKANSCQTTLYAWRVPLSLCIYASTDINQTDRLLHGMLILHPIICFIYMYQPESTRGSKAD